MTPEHGQSQSGASVSHTPPMFTQCSWWWPCVPTWTRLSHTPWWLQGVMPEQGQLGGGGSVDKRAIGGDGGGGGEDIGGGGGRGVGGGRGGGGGGGVGGLVESVHATYGGQSITHTQALPDCSKTHSATSPS